jgi:hypothetical protein
MAPLGAPSKTSSAMLARQNSPPELKPPASFVASGISLAENAGFSFGTEDGSLRGYLGELEVIPKDTIGRRATGVWVDGIVPK